MALKSVREVARELGVSPGTLYSLARSKSIPHVKIGDRILLDVEKIIEALEIQPENASRPSVLRTNGRLKVAKCK